MPQNTAQPTIGIAMATYNGEPYLREQIESLQQQTYPHWHLYVRDDGSKDNTVALLKAIAQQEPRMTVLEDQLGNLGFNFNFYQVLASTQEDYIAFCDQDDVWDTRKLQKSLTLIQQIEGSEQKPALVHADAELVDSQLNQIKARFIGKRGNKKGIDGILFANSVQGASVLMNRSLANLAIPIKPRMPFDFHIALIASLTGTRAYIDEPLAKYRQHSNNAIGAIGNASTKAAAAVKQHYTLSFLAGLAVYTHLKAELSTFTPVKELSDYFYLFEGKSRLKKLWIYLKHRYPTSRIKDTLLLLEALLRNHDLKAIYAAHVTNKLSTK